MMLRLVVIATLTLAVAYVALQEGTAQKATTGTNALLDGVKRLLSPDVPLIKDHSVPAHFSAPITPPGTPAKPGGTTTTMPGTISI